MKKSLINKYIIPRSSSIKESMKILEAGERRIGFIVDKNFSLIKAVSDGDIVRYLINSKNSINDPVFNIHERRPIFIRENFSEDDKKNAFSKSIDVLPILNEKDVITDIIFKDNIIDHQDIHSKKIGIVGLGYVGLTLGLVLADKGFNVSGFDINKDLIDQLNSKKSPFFENGIDLYIKKNIGKRLNVTHEVDKFSADIYIISVGTPIDKKTLLPNTKSLHASIEIISKALKINDLVIMRSTMPINFTNKFVIPNIKKLSGLEPGKDFFISVCPERTIEGNALNELTTLPQIIGGYDHKSSELSASFFNEISHTVVDVGSLQAAEMSKLIDNSYRDHRFAFANNMSILSEKLNVDFNDIVKKANLGYDRNDIPLPSPGVGGPCLSKDPYILSKAFNDFNLSSDLILNVRKINESGPKNISHRIKNYFNENKNIQSSPKIFIIGFAFKGNPETSDLRDSTTLWLVDELRKQGFNNLYGFDPVIDNSELEDIGIKTCSVADGFNSADAVLIMNNHLSYNKLDIINLSLSMNKKGLLYDAWSMFSQIFNNNSTTDIKYFSVGK